jgi:hypothetical protein
MGKIYHAITDDLRSFIAEQPVFFVATSPLAADAHVNISPKGLDTFRVVAPDRVAYLDLTGSGNETSAHLHENGRITVMFCAFAGPPRILRLYGRGRTILPGSTEWNELLPGFRMIMGARQIIDIVVERVQTSCGFGVPLMDNARPRDTLIRWAEAKGEDGLERYRSDKNVRSIDGLPAPVSGVMSGGER